MTWQNFTSCRQKKIEILFYCYPTL